ncbi:Protein 21.1 [Giardia lamblia P15]|uniref:Protein 21.1 n=1 Tax=Giardia intestinalis (strain P15) TaxID=658858 RepID=E1F1B9_GIAIA|nr:Protein 21.1 [Giardia lamblia P15]
MDVASSKEWFSSISHEDVEAVQKNAEQRAGTKTEDGDTGLLLATKSGLVKVVSILARYESGHRDAVGLTALAIGILERNLSICRLLAPYEACISVFLRGEEKAPMILALETGCLDIVATILEYIDLSTEANIHGQYIVAAVSSGRLDVVKYALKHCAVDLKSIERALPIATGEIEVYLRKIHEILCISTCPMCGHVNLANFSVLPLHLMTTYSLADSGSSSATSADSLEKDKIILTQKLEIERLRKKLAEFRVSLDSAGIELTENKEHSDLSCFSDSSQLRDLSTMNHLDTQDKEMQLSNLEEENLGKEIQISIMGVPIDEVYTPTACSVEPAISTCQRSSSMPNIFSEQLLATYVNDSEAHLRDFVSQQLHRYRTIRIEQVGNAEVDMHLVKEMREKPFDTPANLNIYAHHYTESSMASSALELPSATTSSTTSLANYDTVEPTQASDPVEKYVYVRLRFDNYEDCLYGTIAEHILPVTLCRISETSDGALQEPITTMGLSRRGPVGQKLSSSYSEDVSDRTPLMVAAAAGDLEVCRSILFDHVGKRTNSGKTALMFAAEGGHADIVKLLLEKEAGKIASSRNQIAPVTALQVAALYGYDTIVSLLLDIEGGIQDKYGFTALMYASANNNVACIKLLLSKEKGLLTNSKFVTGQGMSALVIATANNNIEAVKLLLPAEEYVPRVRSKAIAYGAGNECVAYIKAVEEKRLAKLQACSAVKSKS